jgi:hypothetical protein
MCAARAVASESPIARSGCEVVGLCTAPAHVALDVGLRLFWGYEGQAADVVAKWFIDGVDGTSSAAGAAALLSGSALIPYPLSVRSRPQPANCSMEIGKFPARCLFGYWIEK